MGDMIVYEAEAEQCRFASFTDEEKAHKSGQCGGRGCCWFCELDAKTVAKPDSV